MALSQASSNAFAAKNDQDVIIIGIDFGTTFSGVAWTYSAQPEDIEIVTSWETELNHCADEEKAPTQLSFGANSGDVSWGYDIPEGSEGLKWFKLLLIDDKDVSADVRVSAQLAEARRLQQSANKTPVVLVAVYLRNIWNHSIDSITRALGKDLVTLCTFRVVITLPAIWPHYAQRRMKEAADLSGMLSDRKSGATTLRFISEPEAAAAATMKDLSKRSNTKAGDTIIVCDAGGGTVDLISYVVEQADPFVIKECVKGDGGLCGGVFLDEAFVTMMESKIKWGSLNAHDKRKFMNDDWEHGIKTQFKGQYKQWLLSLPNYCRLASGSKKGNRDITLTREDLTYVFDPIVDKIINLVQRQASAILEKFDKKPDYIVLVGGFGRSQYLFERMQSTFVQPTAVLQLRGTKPWTAICRGAVIQNLCAASFMQNMGVEIQSRVARLSYGVKYRDDWDEEKYVAYARKEWCDYEQSWMAEGLMEWFLKRGDDMRDTSSYRKTYYRLLPVDQPIGGVENSLWYSEDGTPSTSNDSVYRLCTIKWNKSVSEDALPTYTNPLGKVFYRLQYDVEMTCDQGITDFAVYHQGKRVASHNVEVEYH